MTKLIAIANTVAWAGFWAFGYLALSAPTDTGNQALIASLLAAVGAGVGLACWFQLVRHTEATGYAKPANRVPEHIKTQGESA
ncbi:hypothetical protein [Maritimibacter sp. UBA3975]|uniref:hypothetical protein n=1 Tax=Maritimibacter sp. UBA3975 TaxID=1946833 RepID=UPI000C0A52F1|nr:hypothetical protein [Maritimibacter sp. UBA3975]MAM63634.1 hypothetical protein [Maritimibacter sp.]|tara:strand:- start:13625 stop:13873 length:249 start_codon:yes stop_codon:yes gene_type:complete